jgi:ankyrin repeat protein
VEVGGITPFWIAANALDIEAMKLLVENGADPTLKNMEDTTLLMVAAGLGTKTRAGRQAGSEGGRTGMSTSSKQFLEWGNDINALNVHGQTALHAAAFAAAHPTVQFFCDRGARTDVKNEIGGTPWDVARDNLPLEYRPSLQNHKPEDVEATINLLEKLSRR